MLLFCTHTRVWVCTCACAYHMDNILYVTEMQAGLPQSALVLGHPSQHVAVKGVEVVVVGDIMCDHLCIDDVALALLTGFVQSLPTGRKYIMRVCGIYTLFQRGQNGSHSMLNNRWQIMINNVSKVITIDKARFIVHLWQRYSE